LKEIDLYLEVIVQRNDVTVPTRNLLQNGDLISNLNLRFRIPIDWMCILP
jgi:hypothetical protein